MALTIGELVAYLTADDRGWDRGLGRAENDLQRFQRDADGRLRDMRGRFAAEGEDAGRGLGGGIVSMATKALKTGFAAGGAVLAPLAGLPLSIAAIGSTAAAAAPLIAQGAAATAEFASSAAGAAPALLALGVAAKIASVSLKAIFAEGTAAREALSPLGKVLEEATEAGSTAAAKGIRPLAEELKRVIQPTVTRYMVEVGEAANTVQKRFLTWAKSAEGVRSIQGILEPISAAMKDLAPEVSNLGIAFTKMLSRIMGVSTAAGSRGLAGAIEWLTEKLNGIDAGDVTEGITTLGNAFRTVKNVVGTLADWIGTLADAYRTYNREFGALADVISVAAIVFGGPVTAIIGAVGLIIRHWDELKAAWEGLKAAFSGEGDGPLAGFFENLRNAAAEVLPSLQSAFEQIKTTVLPILDEIWQKVQNELVPAFGEFVEAIAPVVSWLVDVLGPVVAETFGNILRIISGAIDIIVGIFQVFTGILTGDWGKAWEGIKNIVSGAWQIIVAFFRQGINLIKGILQLLWGILTAIWSRGLEIARSGARAIVDGVVSIIRGGVGMVRGAFNSVKNAITGVFSGAGSWLVNAGKNILRGLLNGIESMIGSIRSKLSSVTNLIPSWKGPESVDRVLLEPAGTQIMSGLIAGIEASLPALRSTLGAVTAGIAGAVPGRVDVAAAGMPGALGHQAVPLAPSPARVILELRGGSDEMKEMVRNWVRLDGGGDVQLALGQ